MGNKYSQVINNEVNQSTKISKELLAKIMDNTKEKKPNVLEAKDTIKMLQLFHEKSGITLSNSIPNMVHKLTKNTGNIFSYNELVGYILQIIPEGK